MSAFHRGVLCCLFTVYAGACLGDDVNTKLQEKQKKLVQMLEQILSEHLGMEGYELQTVDSETSFVVQIFYPKVYTAQILGQSGTFLRSLKIIFNDLYLYAQESSVQKLNNSPTSQKKMHLRFVEKD